jgi:8-oxo-dGTP pyrophosphatase MutT (NUDIX family)
VYHDVWHALLRIQKEKVQGSPAAPRDRTPKPAKIGSDRGPPPAYGGVIVRNDGCVLIQRVANDFDGYKWTFPKGRPEQGEVPEATALREVREESGVEARIVGELDGWFSTGHSRTKFYLMAPVKEHGDFNKAETTEVLCATFAEAEKRLAESTKPEGRKRDQAVLQAARAATKLPSRG